MKTIIGWRQTSAAYPTSPQGISRGSSSDHQTRTRPCSDSPVARRTTASATWSSSNSRDGAPRVFLSGPSGGPGRYTKPAMTRVTGVRLRPGVGYLLRRRPMCALVNRRVRCPAPELVRQMAGAQRLDGTSLGPRAVGRRQLERLMRVWVGVSPKRLARMARFQSLRGNVADGPPKDWTQMAAESYAGQSHLIYEFAEFAGACPRRFYAGQSADASPARCG